MVWGNCRVDAKYILWMRSEIERWNNESLLLKKTDWLLLEKYFSSCIAPRPLYKPGWLPYIVSFGFPYLNQTSFTLYQGRKSELDTHILELFSLLLSNKLSRIIYNRVYETSYSQWSVQAIGDCTGISPRPSLLHLICHSIESRKSTYHGRLNLQSITEETKLLFVW